MNKFLRYSLVGLMAILFGNVSAQDIKTCADVIAGEDGTTFRVKGECTKITNTTYGNWNLKDATGEIYIYGTLDAEGKTKNFSSLGIEVGDIVTVEGPKKTFNSTIELVDVTVIAIEKGSKSDTSDSQPADVKTVTIADFNAAAESNDVWYQLTGIVKNLKKGDKYGNFDLEDETGSVYVYGLLSEKGGEKQKFQELVAEKGIKEGSKLTIIGNRGSYKDKIEVMNAYFVSVEGGTDTPEPQPAEVKTVTIADFNAAAESNDVWYQLTGNVKNLKEGDKYGNFDLEDETGSVYVYGLLSEKGGEKQKFQELVAEKGIKEGSKITIIGNRGSYKDKIEVMNAYFVSIEEVEEGLVWDFTKWSAATIANLKADAAASKLEGWSDVEKKADAEADAEPTETSKDNCFWCVAEANADGTLSANGVAIEELKGLVFNSDYSTARSLAIAVNYPSALSDYAGGAYLWLGGKGKHCFTIPNVAAGSVIIMDVESHKASDARGIQLKQGDAQIGDTFTPTTKDSYSWTIDTAGDVEVWNTNGCHIYKIVVTSSTAIQTVKPAKADNGYIYNLAGQRVEKPTKGIFIKNGKKFIVK